MYRTIFVMANSIGRGKHGVLKPGPHSFKRMCKYYLRQRYEQGASYIDPDASHLNEVWAGPNQDWIKVDDDQVKNKLYQKVSKQYDAILKLFKEQLANKSAVYAQQRKLSLQKSWAQYINGKNITGEWIIGASRSWFEANDVIHLTGSDSFTIKSQEKVKQWANVAANWAYQNINQLYHPQAFAMAYLHLDESNVHLHVQHVKFRHFFDKRQRAEVYAFSNPPELTPNALKSMQKEYENVLNQELVEKQNWKHKIEPKLSQRRYVNFLRFKVKALQAQCEMLEQNVTAMQKWEGRKIKLAEEPLYQKIRYFIRQSNPKLWKSCADWLISLGYSEEMVKKLFAKQKKQEQIKIKLKHRG